MNIDFHDLKTQYASYKDEIEAAISSVIASCQFIMGEDVKAFESELGNFLGAQVVSCANGTDALMLALMAIGLKPGDEVITTPFTFIATSEVISFLGARPVFVDIQNDTYNIHSEQIAAKITPRTRAILPVCLYGQPADFDEINEIANHFSQKNNKKIYVIEDAAQSLGAEYKGKKSGNLGDIGCLSFFPTKPLGCYGDGGALVVNDDLLAERLKSLRSHGQTKRYFHKYVGVNSRLDTLQAAILRVKLKYFHVELQNRLKIATYYNSLLAKNDITVPFIKTDRTSAYAQYSIRVKNRDDVVTYLKSKDIPVAIHYPMPLHQQPCFSDLNYQVGKFPIAEQVSQEILSLPMSAFITEEQIQHVAKAVIESTDLSRRKENLNN